MTPDQIADAIVGNYVAGGIAVAMVLAWVLSEVRHARRKGR